MVVEITVDIPDEVDPDDLCLDNKLEDINVVTSYGNYAPFVVTGYTTTNIYQDTPEEE